MSSLQLENTMNVLLRRHTDLSQAQSGRIACVLAGLLLAGTTHLSQVARWLRIDSQQFSREMFLRRLLSAAYLSPVEVYHPLVRQALERHRGERWHVVMDWSTIVPHQLDFLMVSLNFRKRAIPLTWRLLDFGCTGSDVQIALLQEGISLVADGQAVVFHGDTEFGSVPMMRFVQDQGWDFVLGQTSHTYFRYDSESAWEYVGELVVTPRRPVYLKDILWTKEHGYGPVNFFAFHAPHQNGPTSPRYQVRYCLTSLPIAHTLRRIGHRRWGTEPLFRDYKSSGWHFDNSAIESRKRRNGLLTLLCTNYLWATCIGRWLCKSGRRREVDHRPSRRFSLFRLGWDWLIHQCIMDNPIPDLLTLYA